MTQGHDGGGAESEAGVGWLSFRLFGGAESGGGVENNDTATTPTRTRPGRAQPLEASNGRIRTQGGASSLTEEEDAIMEERMRASKRMSLVIAESSWMRASRGDYSGEDDSGGDGSWEAEEGEEEAASDKDAEVNFEASCMHSELKDRRSKRRVARDCENAREHSHSQSPSQVAFELLQDAHLLSQGASGEIPEDVPVFLKQAAFTLWYVLARHNHGLPPLPLLYSTLYRLATPSMPIAPCSSLRPSQHTFIVPPCAYGSFAVAARDHPKHTYIPARGDAVSPTCPMIAAPTMVV
jgi:hypothetical protein